jgi:hypothetical protein
METEGNKEVIEKLLECVRDLADEMGPASLESHIEWVITSLENLLDKKTTCQVKGGNDGMGDDEQDEEDSEPEEDEEDLDHDEIILGNTTDVIISVSKCMGESFGPYLQRLGPKMVTYLGDEHPKSDKVMVIGCLAEVFNNCPSAIAAYFGDFMGVLIKHSTTEDGSMNRNVSYGIGIFADKAPVELFQPHLETAMTTVKTMYAATKEDDAKDNCIACLVRILERYRQSLPPDQYNILFEQIMSAVPLNGDPNENETVLKFIMNVNATEPDSVKPHMERITMMCLKLLTDPRCDGVDDVFKVITATFIKHVVMSYPEMVERLQALEAQMSAHEKAILAKYLE